MFKIEKTFSKANIPKTIRFTEKLDKELTTIARNEDISFNELVLRCCWYAIGNYECSDCLKGKEEKNGDAKYRDL